MAIDSLAAVARNPDLDGSDGWASAKVVASDIAGLHPGIGDSVCDAAGPRYEYEATRRALAALRRSGVVDARLASQVGTSTA